MLPNSCVTWRRMVPAASAYAQPRGPSEMALWPSGGRLPNLAFRSVALARLPISRRENSLSSSGYFRN